LGDFERQIGAFVDHYTTRLKYESLGNIAPSDVCHRSAVRILKARKKIKKRTTQCTVKCLQAGHGFEIARRVGKSQ